jgi:cytochrome c biogenesis protein CcdA
VLTAALLAAVAGLLSLLSPCVLPLLPAIIASAFAGHRHGPTYLAFGIALSFAGMGLLTAIAGRWLIFDPEWLRLGTAFIMVISGVVLLAPPVQAQLGIILAPLASAFSPRVSRTGTGASGQFTLGLLLGAVWSPCVGPTLGAAIVLAARGEDLVAVATTMFAFGLGAGLPLFLLSLLPRERFLAARTSLLRTHQMGKLAIGAAMTLAGLVVLSGADRILEARLVSLMPVWLVALTTRF